MTSSTRQRTLQPSMAAVPTDKIIVQNTCIIVTNVTTIPPDLLKFLTEFDNRTKYSNPKWTAAISHYSKEYGNYVIIPKYISYAILKKAFPAHEIVYHSHFSKYTTVNIECKFEPRDELQKNGLDYLNATGDYSNTDSILKNRVKVINTGTGTGKTFMAIKYLAQHGFKANIFVHKAAMIDSPWMKDILNYVS